MTTQTPRPRRRDDRDRPCRSVRLGAQQPVADWPAVAGDVGGMKYSPAIRSRRPTSRTLKEAWSYQAGGPAPIVINNVMYFVGGGNVVALNADTGTEIWKFALSEATPGGAIRRGMTYWPGTPPHAPRVLVTMSGGKLVQLDAKTGKLVPQVGVIDLVDRDHGPDSRRRVVHDRVAGRGLQEPRDLSRPHR